MINKEKILKFYEDAFDKFGDDNKSLHWNFKNEQLLRFEVLCEAGIIPGSSLLDFGCGLGHFYEFIKKEKKMKIDYTGIDISEKMINFAKKKYPKATFMHKSIYDIEKKYDFVVESGVFNACLGTDKKEWAISCHEFLTQMYKLCKIGVAFNMISNRVDYRAEGLYYGNPVEWFHLAKKMCKYVVLRHDYPLYDFTIYMYRRSEI